MSGAKALQEPSGLDWSLFAVTLRSDLSTNTRGTPVTPAHVCPGW